MEAFWNQLRPEDRTALSSAGYLRVYRTGSELYLQDRRSETVMILMDVHAKVVRRAGAREAWLAYRGPGDIVGEMSLVDGKPHAATVATVCDGNVLAIPHYEFDRLIRQNDRLRRALLRVVVQRLRHADIVRSLGEEGPRIRIVRLLLDRTEPKRAVGRANPAQLRYQREIAELLGVSRATVVRELSRLKKDYIIETNRGRITVLDPVRLSHLLSEDVGR